jgi:coenzyme F420-reducing hydrogenase delta subunit
LKQRWQTQGTTIDRASWSLVVNGAAMQPQNWPEPEGLNIRSMSGLSAWAAQLASFLNGAAGIFIGACPPGDCHFFGGNRFVQDRFHNLRDLLKGFGFDPRRLQLEWITPDDPNDFVEKITNFTNLVGALGQSPVSRTQVV